MTAAPFLLDSNVFIEAHRRYYNQRICPGFWKALQHYCQSGLILSIDKVKTELLTGKDELSQWVKQGLPANCFAVTNQPDVVEQYGKIQNWAMQKNVYPPAALSTFADTGVADAWIAAFAKTHNCTVVTHESNDPATKKRVLLPIVCQALSVPVTDTFVLLHKLEVQFDWSQTGP